MRYQKFAAISCTLLGITMLVLGAFFTVSVPQVAAQDAVAPTGDDSFCVICHSAATEQMTTFVNGDTLSIAVDRDVLSASVHGTDNPEGALGCVDCHGTDNFPHDNAPAALDARNYRIEQSNTCVECHEDHTANLADDVHYTALVAGNLRAATCVDCHGAHDVQHPTENPTAVVENCGDCHLIVFDDYQQSVHGVALFNGDENVPTCASCHGVHGIAHPTTALFRNNSPELCADCHADEALMTEYDISTNVFDSYLTDFHGATIALFEQDDPNVASNKAVCSDCHGVHNITPADDSKSQVVRENLLATCQECHPGATSDFPDSWVGHFEPTLDSHPLLYLVMLFYDILIPVVVLGFVFLVATDIFRRIRTRGQTGGHHE